MKLILIASLLCTTAALSAVKEEKKIEKKIECPAAIWVTPKEEISADAPTGWSAQSNPIRRELSGATLYDGLPKFKASLVPDDESHSSKSAHDSRWTLTANKDSFWLECQYGLTAITISKAVPGEAKQCFWTEQKIVGINPNDPTRKKAESIYCN